MTLPAKGRISNVSDIQRFADLDRLDPGLHAVLMRFLDLLMSGREVSWLDFEDEIDQYTFESLIEKVFRLMPEMDH